MKSFHVNITKENFYFLRDQFSPILMQLNFSPSSSSSDRLNMSMENLHSSRIGWITFNQKVKVQSLSFFFFNLLSFKDRGFALQAS